MSTDTKIFSENASLRESDELSFWLSDIQENLSSKREIKAVGRIRKIIGTLVQVSLDNLLIGELCTLRDDEEGVCVGAEVVGFDPDGAIVCPIGDIAGLSSKAEVISTGKRHQLEVGPHLLGSILNGYGEVVQPGPVPRDPNEVSFRSVDADPPDPMSRAVIQDPLPLGVRALDGMITCGEGQRMGIFAGAGVGKSTLMAQIVRSAKCDVVVIGLIGERGREVREFIENDLGEEAMRHSVLVIATSDRPPLEKLKAAYVATAIAEHFRDQNKSVLMLVDSLTRMARAQREIGLSAGEPATRQGYPPSAFAILPRLLERAGQSDKGSITALYTTLLEGSDWSDDPIAEEVKSIVDGHIVLSQKLAAKGHYPAIDVMTSKSRVMNHVTSKEHQKDAGQFREWMALYNEVELLIKMGEYTEGADLKTDLAVKKQEEINEFLRQNFGTSDSFEMTLEKLKAITQNS